MSGQTFHTLIDSFGDGELDKVAFTARWVAAERALESDRPDALFNDPLAAALGGQTGEKHSELMRPVFGKMYDWEEYHVVWTAVRTKYIDDKLTAFANQWAGTGFQFVDIGSGLDTRTFRLDCLRKCSATFEIDLSEVTAAKERILPKHQAESFCPRIGLSADLSVDNSLTNVLKASGYKDSLPTFWLMEGLTFYLSDAVNHSLMRQLESLGVSTATPGSGRHALCSGFCGDSSKMLPDVPFTPTPEVYGTFVKQFGFSTIDIALYGDSQMNFGRYPIDREPDASMCFCYATN